MSAYLTAMRIKIGDVVTVHVPGGAAVTARLERTTLDPNKVVVRYQGGSFGEVYVSSLERNDDKYE